MDVKGFVEFLTAYPAWAKIAVVFCLAVTAGVLVLAKPEKQKPTSGDRPVLLTIERVSLFPDDPSAQVKILAHVNGTVFEHPSLSFAVRAHFRACRQKIPFVFNTGIAKTGENRPGEDLASFL